MWKEEFDKEWWLSGYDTDLDKDQYKLMIPFIETEIIKKLIEEMIEVGYPKRREERMRAREQLRAKWLS